MVKVGDYAYFLEEDIPKDFCSFLTPGKKYLIKNCGIRVDGSEWFELRGIKWFIVFIPKQCAYLRGGSWRFTSYEKELEKILK